MNIRRLFSLNELHAKIDDIVIFGVNSSLQPHHKPPFRVKNIDETTGKFLIVDNANIAVKYFLPREKIFWQNL